MYIILVGITICRKRPFFHFRARRHLKRNQKRETRKSSAQTPPPLREMRISE